MTTTENQVSNFNIANVLTTLRIVLVPVLAWALLHDGGDSTMWRWIAFGIFVVAMITDKIDGDLARKHNLITDFGSIVGDIWWWVTIVVLIREWSVTLLRLSVLKQVVIPAAMSGKIKTTFQAIALSGLMLPLPHGDAHGGAFDAWGGFGEALFYLSQVFLAGAVIMTLWSGYEFFRAVWQQRRTPTA
jgi:CDP-diacylglycerol---glycerol-3-phosphate 3-phosphatidyltransferase